MIQALFTVLLLFSAFSADKPDSEIIESVTEVNVTGGKLKVYESNLIQVNNRKGEWFNPIKIYFNKIEQVSDIRIRIETTDGVVLRTIRQSEFKEESAVSSISFYEDQMVKKIVVTHNQYPYRIRYSYRRTSREFLTLTSWQPYLDPDVPVRYAKLVVTIPGDYRVNIHQQNIDHQKTADSSGKITFTWEASDLKAYRPERFSPPFITLVPYVHVVPVEFHYGVDGNQSSWESYGNWVYRLNKGRGVLPQEEQERIEKLVRGTDNNLDRVRNLYHDMQDHTRYINVSIDRGGLQTYPASYVCKNGYGDCKALSNFLHARLNYLGIRSFYTLVRAGDNPPPFLEDFPSSQFNHVILCVPSEEDTLWLECTSNTAPFGYLSSFIQNRPALIVDRDESRLIRIPALQPEQVTEKKTLTLNLLWTGNTSEDINLELKGDGFEYLRYIYRIMEERVKNRYILDYLGIPETDLESWSINHPGRDSPVIYLKAVQSAKDQFTVMGRMVMVRPQELKIPDMESPEKRKYPVCIPAPVHRIDRLDLTIPKRAVFQTVPADTTISNELGSYSRKARVESGHLLLDREFTLPVMKLPLSEYRGFYEFFQSVKTLESERIIYRSE